MTNETLIPFYRAVCAMPKTHSIELFGTLRFKNGDADFEVMQSKTQFTVLLNGDRKWSVKTPWQLAGLIEPVLVLPQ